MKKMKFLILVISLIVVSTISGGDAATCDFVPPLTSSSPSPNDDADFGFIMIPGAQIAGEAYKPLALKIQSVFPRKLWLGLTDFFLADFPNPIEISSAITACFDQARSVLGCFCSL